MVGASIDDQMISGNDALYTVTSEVTKENKKYKASNRQLNSFEEAVEFFHN